MAAGSASARTPGPWLLCVAVLNLLLCSANAYDGDINYWIDWIGQLQKRGFAGLDANYPPVYMFWLWLVARFHESLQLVPENGLLLRCLVTAPVALAHMLALLLAHHCLNKRRADDRTWQQGMALLALNPAILMNGPVWGQVDMIFSLFLVLSLYALIEGRYLVLVMPVLCIALLTKFQAICVAPALAPLLWHHRKSRRLWLGLLPAALAAGLLLLPYLLANSLGSMFRQTYIQASSLYPYATYHANNLWQLVGLNTRPDNLYLLDLAVSPTGWRVLLTPKHLGIALFGLWSLWLFISGLRSRDASLHWRNAILSALGFFLLLPGMHERYLFPAVSIALIAASRFSAFRTVALWLSVLCFANMCFVLHPSGGALPYLFAALTLGLALRLLVGKPAAFTAASALLARLSLTPWWILAIVIWALTISWQVRLRLPDHEGWLDATRIPGRTSSQAWGDLQTGNSVDGRMLVVAGQRHARGFGTHAESVITIPVPPGAERFSTQAGLDDETRGGEVSFFIRLDGRTLWSSGRLAAGAGAVSADIDVRGGHSLQLVVDPLGSNANDHADWLSPRFRIAR